MEPDALYYGDCLDWMERWPDRSVDLIYLDPPFNSNASYNILFGRDGDEGGGAQFRAFDDTWHWDAAAVERYGRIEGAAAHPAHSAIIGLHTALGPTGMMAYLTYMAERLAHMHRLLKPTGSIYLHCDPTASHYIKVMMDAIFGHRNFRREIVWSNEDSSGFKSQAKNWIRGHDSILYYARDDRPVFNKEYHPLDERTVRRYDKVDEKGARFKIYRKPGGSERRSYLKAERGAPLGSVWRDIRSFQTVNNTGEYLGYPTQKPLALLDRIVRASSNEGDIVLDPFCGCGTAVDAARRLNRRWIGIDISAFAIDLIRERRLKDSRIPVHGIPFDMSSARKLARERPFDFESWAVTRLTGIAPNTRQRGDGGVDGRGRLAVEPDNHDSRLALAQVKGGAFHAGQLRDFRGVMERDRAAMGYFVTLDPVTSTRARQEAAMMGDIRIQASRYPRMQLWSISDYFDGRMPAMPPMTDPYTGKAMQPNLL